MEQGYSLGDVLAMLGNAVDGDSTCLLYTSEVGSPDAAYHAPCEQDARNLQGLSLIHISEEVKDELEKIGPPKEFKKTPQPKTVMPPVSFLPA